MNAPDHFFLPDVQSAADTRRLAIQNVGVKGLRYPLQIENASGEVLNTVAKLDHDRWLAARGQGYAHVALRRAARRPSWRADAGWPVRACSRKCCCASMHQAVASR